MHYVRFAQVLYRFSYFSRFVNEEWTGMLPPTEPEALALLRKGADGRKNFVAWFMEEVNFHTSLLPSSPYNSN